MNQAEPDPAAGGAPLDRVPAEVTQPASETPPAATETFPLPGPEQAPPVQPPRLVAMPRASKQSRVRVAVIVSAGVLRVCTVPMICRTPVPLVSTYAYVNPVVAVFLGWAILGEPVTWLTLVAGALIVSAVALIVSRPGADRDRVRGGGGAAPVALGTRPRR